MQKIELSICIVSYKSDNDLKKCLASIQRSQFTKPCEIIVVDNNESKSGVIRIVKKVPNARSIKSKRNGGYGAGNNIAIAESRGKYIFILNPDVVLQKDTIKKLHSFLQKNKNRAGVGPAFQYQEKRRFALGMGELTPIRGIFALSFINKLWPNNIFSTKYYLNNEVRKVDSEVWALPGSASFFRRDALIQVGGYDENIFLYFEENDLGRRLKTNGWELWITNSTTIFHEGGKSTNSLNSQVLRNIFQKSRYLYFKKHFGMINALVVELAARFGKFEAVLLISILVGMFLRFYNVSETVVFHGELGHNYLAMKNITSSGTVPLLGPPTSHPWLSFGPLFYWIFTPVLVFVQYSPVAVAYVFAFLHTLLIGINYLSVTSIHGKKTAAISSFFISISPAYLYYSHESRFFGLVLILFYPFYYCLIKQRYFLTGLLYAFLLNFHLSPIIFFPVIVIYTVLKQRKILFETFKKLFFGVFVGFLPFFLYNFLNNFQMLGKIALWIPYRIAGFFGIIPKNTVDSSVVNLNLEGLIEFLKSSVLQPNTSLFTTVLVLIFIIVLMVKGVRGLDKTQKSSFSLLLSFLAVGYVAIFVHGSPPLHYFLPLLPILILVMSLCISTLNKFILYTTTVFLIICFINFPYFFSKQWFFKPQNYVTNVAFIPYKLQLEATNAIYEDSRGENFSLKRVGEYDYFEKNYSQNYIYLLWKKGNEPIDYSNIVYTIYEVENILKDEKIIFSKGGLTVTKKYENYTDFT